MTPPVKFKQVSAGEDFSMGLGLNGRVYSWGNNAVMDFSLIFRMVF